MSDATRREREAEGEESQTGGASRRTLPEEGSRECRLKRDLAEEERNEGRETGELENTRRPRAGRGTEERLTSVSISVLRVESYRLEP